MLYLRKLRLFDLLFKNRIKLCIIIIIILRKRGIDVSTIKDIASKANVSIATVSHVINKTRYVSPELEKLVSNAMYELNYHPQKRSRVPKIFKAQYVGIIYPNSFDKFHNLLVRALEHIIKSDNENYQFCLIPTDRIVLTTTDISYYKNKMNIDAAIVSLIEIENKTKKEINNFPTVQITLDMLDNLSETGITELIKVNLNFTQTIDNVISQLNKKGHSKILILYSETNKKILDHLLTAFQCNELTSHNKKNQMIKTICLSGNEETDIRQLNELVTNKIASAFVSLDYYSKNCFLLLQSSTNFCIPDDFSLISLTFDENESILSRYLTNIREIAQVSLQGLQGYRKNQTKQIRSEYIAGSSLSPIARGPFGEKAAEPNSLKLCEQELIQISNQKYSVGISFHQGDTLWAKLHEKGIRDVFDEIGIPIVSVMNANFDANLQNEQLQSLIRMNVDAIISIPVDEKLTAPAYQKIITQQINLVLITNVPEGLSQQDYVTCISVNEQKNGATIAKATGDFMKHSGLSYLGLINHGANFFATKQRDTSYRDTIEEDFPEIEISDRIAFHTIDHVRDVAKRLLSRSPIIEVLYVCWEEPARIVLDVLAELGRTDIKIFTTDIDAVTAKILAQNDQIIATSTQRFYEQGRAMAMATLCSFVGKKVPSFIAIDPILIESNNLEASWENIAKEPLPLKIIEKN